MEKGWVNFFMVKSKIGSIQFISVENKLDGTV